MRCGSHFSASRSQLSLSEAGQTTTAGKALFDAVLVKPFTPSTLLDTLLRALLRQRFHKAADRLGLRRSRVELDLTQFRSARREAAVASAQDSLFVMVQDKGQDLDHFLVSAKPLEQPYL